MRSAVVLLLFAGAVGAAPPPEVAALQKHVHEIFDAAKSSVACVLISRSDKYAAFGQGSSAAAEGQLGEFRPPVVSRFDRPEQKELIGRLDLANPETVPESYGSGVVIDETGLVLTNYHVIAGATKVFVRLPGPGRGSFANIHAADQRADLAVLKMIHPPAGLKPIAIGDGGKARPADFVLVLANPFTVGVKNGNPSVSAGMISNTHQHVLPPATKEIERVKPLSQYATLLQTDARIALGCSGGALLNLDGELIGLTTATAAVAGGEAGGGYAIPTDANTRRMIDVLKRGEEIEYGFLGVMVNPDGRGEGRGVVVQDVSPGMPAARAGIFPRDVIAAINGEPVREQDDLFLLVSAAQANTVAKVEIDRNGRRYTVDVRLTKSPLPANMTVIASNRPKPVFGLRVDYASTLALDTNPPEGVLVRELEPGSPADKKLKDWYNRAKLIVTAVDGRPVPTPADFYAQTRGKSKLTLDVVEYGGKAAQEKVTLP